VKRFLLDTGPAQQFLNNTRGIRQVADRERQRGHRIGICTPVLGELWSGIEGSTSPEENRQRLIHGLSRLLLWPYDSQASQAYGRIFAQLRRMGRPMQQVDIQVAAIAFALGNTTVVTADSDFSAIPGLTVENWAER
jgi:tRNA(fMet)-specific endonuclease VapC